jgi:hypothetical protein
MNRADRRTVGAAEINFLRYVAGYTSKKKYAMTIFDSS